MKNKQPTTGILSILMAPLLLFCVNAFAAQPQLTVYTYGSFASDWGPGPKVKAAFEKQCNCDLKFISLDDGVSILNRLRLEGKNNKADIVLGLDNNLIETARKTGLLAPHNVSLNNLKLPVIWTDNIFVPFDYGYFSFIYNKENLKTPPKSLKELVERKDIRIIYQDPRTSTPGLGLMLWVKSVYGDESAKAWNKIARKTVTVTKGWTESYNMFLKGEADMVLSYSTSPAYHLIAEKENKYVAADFSEGHYLEVEVAAKVKNTKNGKLADQFLSFITSDAFQSTIATGNWMYPVTDIPLPPAYSSLTLPKKTLSFTAKEITKKKKVWTREWLNAMSE